MADDDWLFGANKVDEKLVIGEPEQSGKHNQTARQRQTAAEGRRSPSTPPPARAHTGSKSSVVGVSVSPLDGAAAVLLGRGTEVLSGACGASRSCCGAVLPRSGGVKASRLAGMGP